MTSRLGLVASFVVGCASQAAAPPPVTHAPAAESCPADAPVPARLVRLAQSELVNHLGSVLGDDVVRGPGAPVIVLQGDHTHVAEERVITSADFGSYRSAARMLARRFVRALPSEAACLQGAEALTCVHGPLKTLLPALYRGALDGPEWLRLQRTFLRLSHQHGGAAALEAVLTAALLAPDVLYRRELGDPGARTLSREEAISFASFALRGREPHEAERAELLRFEGPAFAPYLARTARQWTREAAFQERVAGFLREWMGVSHLRDKLVRPSLAGGGDGNGGDISGVLADEFDWFVKRHFLSANGSFGRLFTAVETRYAPALEGIYGGRLFPPDRIVWDHRVRKGVLGLGAVLAAHASEAASDPVQRGMLVRLRLLCEPMPPPVPNADLGKVGVTPQMQTRERYEALAAAPACRGCHRIINPPGYLFEAFDQYGRYRTLEKGRPIDDRGGLPAFFGAPVYAGVGQGWSGIVDLAEWLAEAPPARTCFAREFSNYVLSARVFDRTDGCALTRIARRFTSSGRIADLVEDLVSADVFLRRQPPAGD